METVKVDMHKLQLLNERIAQTIDALNQLRLSVHGIQHTPYGYPQTLGYGGMPQFVQPHFVQPQFVQPQFVQQPTPSWSPMTPSSWAPPFFGNGLSHSTWSY